MKRRESGFTLIELSIGCGIMVLIICAAAIVTSQVLKGTGRTNDHITALHQVENAGHWIYRDAQMAESITIQDLTPPEFLILRWTDWGYDEASVYHTVTYSIEDVSGGIGKLKRTRQDSGGGSEERLVAELIYYDPDDHDNTTQVSYEDQKLTLKLVTLLGESQESQVYQINCRPDFFFR